jgi:hypothetical protein
MKKSELRQIIKEELAYVKRILSEDKEDLDQRIRDYLHDRYDSDPSAKAQLKKMGFTGQEISSNKNDVRALLAFAAKNRDKILAHLVKQYIAA